VGLSSRWRRGTSAHAGSCGAPLARAAVIVPAVVVTETTRGGPRDATVNRVIKTVEDVAPVTEDVAREAGRLLAGARKSNATMDALVVASAARRESTIILTGDIDDITALAANYPHVRVEGV
jgi:predicted nucleic acid-binding protein